MFKNNKGFSLMELIVALAIMAVATTILIPAYVNYLRNSEKNIDSNRIEVINNSIKEALSEEEVIREFEKNMKVTDASSPTGYSIVSELSLTITSDSSGKVIIGDGVISGGNTDVNLRDSVLYDYLINAVNVSFTFESKTNFGKKIVFTMVPKTTTTVAKSTYIVGK